MGRNRKRIVDKRMAMVIKTDDGQNKPFFPGVSFAYIFSKNASASLTASLTD
jgi:hypothetical protein